MLYASLCTLDNVEQFLRYDCYHSKCNIKPLKAYVGGTLCSMLLLSLLDNMQAHLRNIVVIEFH